MNQYLIVADGDFQVKEIILEAATDCQIVALDGAANKLIALDITPHLIIGDMDSINLSAPSIQKIILHHHDEQDTTDLVKAIRHCDKHGAKQISIVCATGGRLDHHEATMRALRSEYKQNRTITIHTEQQSIRYAHNETVTIAGESGDKCGVFAYPKAKCTSHGLKFEMTNFELDFAYSESVSNELISPTATINMQGDALIIMPPQLISQREFMRLSKVEQLEQQLRDAMRFHNR
jgi:thiamine pyrophosphokinase